MLKERINKILENKYFDAVIIVCINIIFFIICNILFTPKYEQVDDFIIMNLISKSDGNYSLYGIQMHPLICGIIILLYKTAINVNWYTIFLLTVQFISFTIIGTIFIKKRKSIGLLMYIVFMFILYLKFIACIQYTSTAMICITAGFLLIIYTLEDIKNINKFNLILAILIIVFGCMIRFLTIVIAIPFMITYAIYKILKDKCVKKILLISMVIVILILLVNITFNVFYNAVPIYKQFLEFNDARTYLHDFNYLYYDGNEEIFDVVNWSENDREIFYKYCFGDELRFNGDSLKKLEEIAKENTVNTITKDKVYQIVLEFLRYMGNSYFGYIILILSILLVYNNYILFKNRNLRNRILETCFFNFIFIASILMHLLYIYLDRSLYRVVFCTYIIALTTLIYTFLQNIKHINKRTGMIICVIYILLISITDFGHNILLAKTYKIEDYSVYREVLEYTNSHKENAYLYTLSMKDRYLAYSIYEKIPDNIFSNVRPLGDWDTYTQEYYDFKERYDMDNLIQDLYLKDNVYLISGDVIWKEEYKEYIHIIVKYIKEHYNIDVKTNTIKEFDKNIKIYKLNINN